MSGIRYGWWLRIVRISEQAYNQIVGEIVTIWKVYDLYQQNLECSTWAEWKPSFPQLSEPKLIKSIV